MKRRKINAIIGYIIFFLDVSIIITCAVLIYESLSKLQPHIIAIAMFAVIVVLAIISTLIDMVRRKLMIERPVNRILEATKRISEGDFSVHLQPYHTYEKYDEYDMIMENINIMATELSKNEVLRTDFVANVSHEIKTPLSIISNYATALQNDKLPKDIRDEYAKTLVQASKRLSDLIVNILKLNKLENQEIYPDKKLTNVGESLRKSIVQIEELIDNKGIHLTCDIDDVELYTDESFLDIVWNNLISNAVKFTPSGGNISVQLKDEQDAVTITVSDTGCGMSADTGARIFDKFYQGDTSHTQQGNGLGLPLVKKVVDILGGEISVSSVLGKGSIFTVRLRRE